MTSIRTKLVASFCAAGITIIIGMMIVVSWKSTASIERQTTSLGDHIAGSAYRALQGHLKLFQGLLSDIGHDARQRVDRLRHNSDIHTSVTGNKRAALQHLLKSRINANQNDFILVYDRYGDLLATTSADADLDALADQAATWPVVARTRDRLRVRSEVDTVTVDGVSSHSPEFVAALGFDRGHIAEGGAITVASAGIMYDDFDDPVGFVVAGKLLNRYVAPVETLRDTLGLAGAVFSIDGALVTGRFIGADAAAHDADPRLDEAFIKQVLAAGRLEQRMTFRGVNYFTISAPLMSVSNQAVAVLTVALPPDDLESTLQVIRDEGATSKTLMRHWMIVSGIAGIIVFVLVAIAVATNITRPIDRVRSLVEKVAEGDLTVRSHETASDEIGAMARAVNGMVVSLNGIAERLVNESNAIAHSSGRLYVSTDQLMHGASIQSKEAKNSATASSHLSDAALQMAHQAMGVAEDSQAARVTATTGKEIVNQSRVAVLSVGEMVDDWFGTVAALNEHSNAIGKVVTVIDDIANRTNLLALNAAIEAARAGENGRGFAVVADEVRQLATQTSASTEEIGAMIKQIQQTASKSLRDIQSGKSSVAEAVRLAEQAAGSLDEIVGAADRVSHKTTGIAAAVEEQSAATEQFSSSVSSIAGVAAETQSSSAAIRSAAESLSGSARVLLDTASWFKLK